VLGARCDVLGAGCFWCWVLLVLGANVSGSFAARRT
jgi:hypothetical protein